MISIGVIGDGPTTRKQAYSLLTDFVAQFNDGVRFVLPGSPRSFSDAVRFVADWVVDNDAGDIAFLLDQTGEQDAYLAEFDGVATAQVKDPEAAVAGQVDHLWVALHEPEKETENAPLFALAEAALSRGAKAYDMSDALFELRPDTDEAQAATPTLAQAGAQEEPPPSGGILEVGITEDRVRAIVREEIQQAWNRLADAF